jgi:hypothetical protein
MSHRKSDLGIPLPYIWLKPSTRPTTVKAEAEEFYTTGGCVVSVTSPACPTGAATDLYRIDVAKDVSDKPFVTTTHIGTMISPPGRCFSLARSPYGTLYSVCGPLFGAQYLATVDPNTGLATQVLGSSTTSGLAVMALAFDPNGTLYAVGDCNPGGGGANNECGKGTPPDPTYNSLYKVNTTTGAFTRVGSTGAPQLFMDLAFDRNGNLFGVTSTLNASATPAILYGIDIKTGAARNGINLVGSTRVMGLAFGHEGKLYATDLVQNPGLYLIEMKTGFETPIAALGPPLTLSSGLELANPR